MVSVERKYLRDSKYMYKKKNMYGLINYLLPTLDLVTILSVICEQRSNLLARLVHENLVQEVAVLEKPNLLSTTEEFSWNSDGQLTTNELHEKTARTRFGRLRTIIKKYGQKEKEFLQQLVNAASVNALPCNESPTKRESEREFCFQHSQLHNCENYSVKLMYQAGQSRQTLKILFDGCALPHIDNSSLSEEKNIHCLISIYDNDLWLRFSSKFYSELEGLTWQHFVSKTIGPVFSWSTVTTMEIKHQIEKLESAGDFPDIFLKSMQHVSRQLYLSSVLSVLDQLHCLLIAVGQQDKCKALADIVDGVPSTRTTRLMIQVCSVYQRFFTTPWKANLVTLSSTGVSITIQDVVDRFSSFLDYCVFWFTTKVKQYLANWSLHSFFLLAHCEMRIVIKDVNAILRAMEEMNRERVDDALGCVLMRQYCDEMKRKADHLEIIHVECIERFTSNYVKLASDFWKEMMPKGRFWKQSRNSGSLPSEPSSYVEHAINHLLQPIVEEFSQLPRCDWIVIQTANAMMKSWRDHILKEQIKFSVIGACQLKVDFDYVKVWLTSKVSEPSDEARLGIANLDIFRHLDEAARLLMIQPKTKKKLSLGNGYGKQNIVHASTVSGSSAISSTSCYDDEPDALEARIFPNKDEWLNLRLRNGKRRIPLVIPDCLKASEQAQQR